jgi:hypothetical protein
VSKAILLVVFAALFLSSVLLQARTGVTEPVRQASSLTITPGKLEFRPQAVGTRSQPATATLTNVSSAEVTISDISASGIDFTQANDCPTNLAPGADCKIDITFTPAVTGPRLGTIIVSGSDPTSPRFLVLSGIGE